MTESPLAAIYGLDWRPDARDDELFFDDANLEVFPGERVALQGPSGSGKTTLLRCLVALEPRESGTIHWQGTPVSPATMRDYRRKTLYLHQEPADIASGTVGANLAFAREMGANAEESLSEARQRELMGKFDLGGLDWDREFQALSIGERQRVAVVRALTLQPQVFLLDEPTAALDAANAARIEKQLLDYLERRPGARALVWVSHDAQQNERIATRTVDVTDL